MDTQAILNLTPIAIGIGIVFVVVGYYALRKKTFSNALKWSLGVWLGPLTWVVLLALAFRFLPAGTPPGTYGWIAAGWAILGFFAFVFYAGGRGVNLPLASTTHVPILVTYWLCNVQVQKSAKSHSTFELLVGLTEHVFDFSLRLEGNPSRNEIERRLSTEALNLFPPRFDEAAMVATGGLDGDTPLKLRVSGPAFRIQPEQQDVTARVLLARPARMLLFSEHQGQHSIRLEFVHAGMVRGGMTVPIRITERSLLLPDWAGRFAIIFGGLAAGAFSIVQIVVKLIEFLK